MYPPISADVDLPAVILWDPYLMYPKFLAPHILKCSQCGNIMNKSIGMMALVLLSNHA